MMRPVWDLLPTAPAAECAALAGAVGVPEVVARLLWQRGVQRADEALQFLTPTMAQLHDPGLLTGVDTAVARIRAAVAAGDAIVVHGDYDVDGITSTVILRKALELLGARVSHFIPERLRDGYGLQPASIDRLHAAGARLIISVDCGIRASDAAARARELGVDLIITDHHEPDHVLPEALAVINPKRPDCAYPDKHLAGVGVALKLVQALCMAVGQPQWLQGFLKLAAIGTVADVVPLVGENRVIAALGLDALSTGPNRVGLRALIDAAGYAGKTLDSVSVGFGLAPRLNAAGRMSSPDLAARLLLLSDETDADTARSLATQLNDENTRRQEEEAGIVQAARALVQQNPDIGARTVLVVAGEQWHRGVIGIVASKLVDAFHRPAIVLSIENGIAHGSCRSIPHFDMLSALESAAPLLTRFGGHRQAAGLTMDAARIREFREAVNAFADAVLSPDDLRPRLTIHAELGLGAIDQPLAAAVATLAPFGAANPKPMFAARGVRLIDGPKVMAERHLSMTLQHEGRAFRAVAWRAAGQKDDVAAHRDALDIAYSIDINRFRGDTRVELTLTDIRPAGA